MQNYVGPGPIILLPIAAIWLAALIAYIYLVRYLPLVSWIGFAIAIAICSLTIWGHIEGFGPLDSLMELRMFLLMWSPITIPLFLSPLIAYCRRAPRRDKSESS